MIIILIIIIIMMMITSQKTPALAAVSMLLSLVQLFFLPSLLMVNFVRFQRTALKTLYKTHLPAPCQ